MERPSTTRFYSIYRCIYPCSFIMRLFPSLHLFQSWDYQMQGTSYGVTYIHSIEKLMFAWCIDIPKLAPFTQLHQWATLVFSHSFTQRHNSSELQHRLWQCQAFATCFQHWQLPTLIVGHIKWEFSYGATPLPSFFRQTSSVCHWLLAVSQSFHTSVTSVQHWWHRVKGALSVTLLCSNANCESGCTSPK